MGDYLRGYFKDILQIRGTFPEDILKHCKRHANIPQNIPNKIRNNIKKRVI